VSRFEVYVMFFRDPKKEAVEIAGPKPCQTIAQVISVTSLMLRETRPFRVLIVDTEQKAYDGESQQRKLEVAAR
jgi:hypothetical protein